ncbi:MAG: chemotaxis protein CheA [Deltaproteobacteria bacterium]|nr:chemotaxis protein CheA [Deltaproteobacteria bacterium]
MPPEDASEYARRAQEEFHAEAQELLELVGRELLQLDEEFSQGREDPERLNAVFRAMHTLKGLAGLFAYERLAQGAHHLEDLLDQLRLGRLALSRALLDDLFTAVDQLGRALASGREDTAGLDQALRRLRPHEAERGSNARSYVLDPSVVAVLSEYEEHRLAVHAARREPLYRVRVRHPLATIDQHLETLKRALKPQAEVITFLPAGGDEDHLELELLVAGALSTEGLALALELAPSEVVTVPFVEGPAETVREKPTPTSGAPVALHPPEPEVRPALATVRVDLRRMDRLLNAVGELGLVRGALTTAADRLRPGADLAALRAELVRLERDLGRNLAALQRGLLEVRMVPLGQALERVAREVRKLSRALGKELRLVITGVDTAVDKVLVEALAAPLQHLVRNAIDHGIEAPELRRERDKPAEGTLAINAWQSGSHVVIEVEDDGAGIDPEAVLARALTQGLAEPEAVRGLDRAGRLSLVFLPGFSTRDRVTETSGRGVGLDVVKTNIARLGGMVDVASEPGVFTRITLTLPITLAILPALVCEVAGRTYALPLASVSEALKLHPEEVRLVGAREVTTLRGATLPLCRLAVLFGHRAPERHRGGLVAVVALAGRRAGFVVDAIQGQRDVVIKPLGASLRGVRGFTGATDLGEQRLALVLDPAGLLEEALSAPDAPGGAPHAT